MRITDTAVDHVLREAHDPQMGARPLKRFLEKHLVSRLSMLILKDELAPGSAVTVDWPSSGDWDFIVTPGPKIEGSVDRTASTTLGRAGSQGHQETELLERSESDPKR